MSVKLKFCQDCRHFVASNCAAPQLGKNLVTGEDELWPAGVLRKNRTIPLAHDEAESCGPDGKWFEALVGCSKT